MVRLIISIKFIRFALNATMKEFIWSSLHKLSLPFVQKDLEEVL